jgi:mannose-1-phosphate guanylyltransferase
LPAQALILAAGLGTRFRPLSSVRAKAAVPVAGRPLIHRIVSWLAAYGVRHLVINLHHRPETIAREVGDGSHLGVTVRYSWEQPILGSAGGPRKALQLIDDDPFFIVNGDTLTDLDLHALSQSHTASGAKVTMALVRNPDPMRYGGVIVAEDGAIVGFPRAGRADETCLFIGVQIASASVFAPLPLGVPDESVTRVYPALMAREPGAVRGFVNTADFKDVGTPRDYLDTCLEIARREGLTGPLVGTGSASHPTARLVDTVVWNDATIEADCRLTRCIVADGVRVPAGLVADNCAIVSDAIVPLNDR